MIMTDIKRMMSNSLWTIGGRCQWSLMLMTETRSFERTLIAKCMLTLLIIRKIIPKSITRVGMMAICMHILIFISGLWRTSWIGTLLLYYDGHISVCDIGWRPPWLWMGIHPPRVEWNPLFRFNFKSREFALNDVNFGNKSVAIWSNVSIEIDQNL